MNYPGNSDYKMWESPIWNPPTDIFETSDALVVRIEIAGMNEDDFLVEVQGKKLIIQGTRSNDIERLIYHQMEINYGEFIVVMDLPLSFETSEVNAVYKNGYLEIALPRSIPRQIKIHSEKNSE